MCLSVFEWDGKAEPPVRCLELPVIVIGSFPIRYVSNCQLSSTYENISTTTLSVSVFVRHVALNKNLTYLLYKYTFIHCINEIWAYNKAEHTKSTV